MSQNQNLVEPYSRRRLIDNFLHFFSLKMFRYSLFKQLKAVSSYVFVILMLIATFGCLTILLTMLNDGSVSIAKNNAVTFKYVFFLVYFPFFTMLIAFKSVQMIRDEIDDGTLLIFNSMPYTRTRMIVEKWLSVQVVCLLYSTIVLLLPISIGYMAANNIGGDDAVLNFKILFSLINTMFLTSFILQLLLTTLAILLSVALSSKATTGLVSMFGSLAFIGSVLPMILSNLFGKTNDTYSKVNYYERAIRESGLKQYIDDPETKKYFEFNNWGDQTESISDVKRKTYRFESLFDVTAKIYLEEKISGSTTGGLNVQVNEEQVLSEIKATGIKIDSDILKMKNDINDANVKTIYDKVKWKDDQPLFLTSYVKKDFNDIILFEKGSKLEKIWNILNSNYFSSDNGGIRNSYEFYYAPLFNSVHFWHSDSFKSSLSDIIDKGQIGMDHQNDGFVTGRSLFIDNPQYFIFLNFIQKLKDIATSFWIPSSNDRESNVKELNEQLVEINKYNKTFKINNYLNWWTQWYMMWHGDLRSQGELSSIFLVPNATANFAISDQTRTFVKNVPSTTGSNFDQRSYEESFISADYSSIKPIVNMPGLYATYVCLSLILSAVTIYVVIRRDFV